MPLPERINREKWVIILEIPVGALHSLISIKVTLIIFFLTIFKFSLKMFTYFDYIISNNGMYGGICLLPGKNIPTWDMLTCVSSKKLTQLSGMHSNMQQEPMYATMQFSNTTLPSENAWCNISRWDKQTYYLFYEYKLTLYGCPNCFHKNKVTLISKWNRFF